MQPIRVHDKFFVPYLSQTEIESAIKQLAELINIDYADECPLFIAILNGSFMFAAELFKSITIPSEICFIKLASYKGTTSSGHIITSIGLDTEIS
ncbi:MAG: hypoxanthine phosphoribosyltransferase, partial [Parafilimonas sp.]